VKTKIRQQLANRKRRCARRIDKTNVPNCQRPMFTARDIHYEIADRTRGLSSGGIGALHALARQVGLTDAIDRDLHLLKFHFPYHESDHVLTFAYNALCDGTCLQDLELRRTDEVFLDALGARRIPDPTTAGDFCRRFNEAAIRQLQDAVHDVRAGVWAEQPAAFFEQALLDMDGFLVETTGQCKQGMDIAHDGTWGYHALVLTLANTGEVLGLVNRSANRPSHEGAAAEVDRALAVCFRGGFRQVLLRGDTDFSQTAHLDRWHADGRVRFLFGYDTAPNLVARAEQLPEHCWQTL
jgi:Transposase DDE domain group 1